MKDGGPAFPRIEGDWSDLDDSDGKHLYMRGEYKAEGGMSLRDWFAGHSGIPLDAALTAAEKMFGEEATIVQALKVRAALRYEEADAMIAERDRDA